MHLIKAAQRNEPLPEKLPQSLMPGRKLWEKEKPNSIVQHAYAPSNKIYS
jgi:hypothetical protein